MFLHSLTSVTSCKLLYMHIIYYIAIKLAWLYDDINALNIQINTFDVSSYNLLRNLDSHKEPGPDGIPPRFLKETSANIVLI